MGNTRPRQAQAGTGKTAPGAWDLTGVLPPGADGLRKAREGLDRALGELESVRGAMPNLDAEGVLRALRLHERMYDLVLRMEAYAYLNFSVDTAGEEAKSSLDSAQEMHADAENRALFFRHWWTGLAEERARELEPANPDYRYLLASWRRMKPFLLEEKVEQAIMTKKTTGSAEWAKHYSMITSALTFTMEPAAGPGRRKGRPRPLVFAELSRFFSSPRPTERRTAYDVYLRKFKESSAILGDIYRTITRDWGNENLKMRGFASPISPRNLENDLSDAVVETLLSSCRKNAGVFREFFRVKAKLLGVKRLRRYDLSAPLNQKQSKTTYEGAVKKVLAAFEAFDGEFARMARRVFDAGHVDWRPRRGKQSGAYCMSVTPGTIPFLLLNFAGQPRDTYTIAHELGHAVHDQLSSAHSILTFQPQLVLAETASVFAEMVLFDKFMREECDPDVKRQVLAEKLASLYSTIGRQAHFTMFEQEAHAAVGRGGTVSELASIYKANLEGQFGDVVSLPDGFSWEWTAIPHIYHTPFYCYAYSFGNLLSLALYDRYTSEGRSFVPTYLKILSYGGSESPAEMLSGFGLDISSEQFWKSGFDVIGRMISELKKL